MVAHSSGRAPQPRETWLTAPPALPAVDGRAAAATSPEAVADVSELSTVRAPREIPDAPTCH